MKYFTNTEEKIKELLGFFGVTPTFQEQGENFISISSAKKGNEEVTSIETSEKTILKFSNYQLELSIDIYRENPDDTESIIIESRKRIPNDKDKEYKIKYKEHKYPYRSRIAVDNHYEIAIDYNNFCIHIIKLATGLNLFKVYNLYSSYKNPWIIGSLDKIEIYFKDKKWHPTPKTIDTFVKDTIRENLKERCGINEEDTNLIINIIMSLAKDIYEDIKERPQVYESRIDESVEDAREEFEAAYKNRVSAEASAQTLKKCLKKHYPPQKRGRS